MCFVFHELFSFLSYSPNLSASSVYLGSSISSLLLLFSTECFDFQATQEIKSPPFSQLSTAPVPSPFYSFFSSPLWFTLSLFFLRVFFFHGFLLISPLSSNPTSPQNAKPHFFCCISPRGQRCLRLACCDTGSNKVKGQLSRDTPLILSTRLSCGWEPRGWGWGLGRGVQGAPGSTADKCSIIRYLISKIK